MATTAPRRTTPKYATRQLAEDPLTTPFAWHAPESARELQRLLGQHAVQPEDLGEQMSLF